MTEKLETKTKVCSICAADYTGWGNNAWPINDGRCCDQCNDLVITNRIRSMSRHLSQLEIWLSKEKNKGILKN